MLVLIFWKAIFGKLEPLEDHKSVWDNLRRRRRLHRNVFCGENRERFYRIR